MNNADNIEPHAPSVRQRKYANVPGEPRWFPIANRKL